MKILFISELFWPYVGGAERLGAKLVSDLRRQGCDLLVLTSHDQLALPDEESYCGVPVLRLPFRETLQAGDPIAVMAVRGRARKIIDGFAPDVIHVYQLGMSTFFQMDTLCAHTAPMIVTVHNDLYASQMDDNNSLFFRVFRAAARITCCSQSVLDQIRELDPTLEARSLLVHNGFELTEMTPAPYPQETMRLLCVGRLVEDKGFDLALEALARIAKCLHGVRMTIAGDGPERGRLEQLADTLGLRSAVEFVGMVSPDRVQSLLAKSNVVLVPSRREGLPVVALESASAARPIVAARAGGLAEMIVDKQTGRLVDVNDVDQLAEATVDLLEQPEMAAKLGLAARQRVQEYFHWQGYVDAHQALYRELSPV